MEFLSMTFGLKDSSELVIRSFNRIAHSTMAFETKFKSRPDIANEQTQQMFVRHGYTDLRPVTRSRKPTTEAMTCTVEVYLKTDWTEDLNQKYIKMILAMKSKPRPRCLKNVSFLPKLKAL